MSLRQSPSRGRGVRGELATETRVPRPCEYVNHEQRVPYRLMSPLVCLERSGVRFVTKIWTRRTLLRFTSSSLAGKTCPCRRHSSVCSKRLSRTSSRSRTSALLVSRLCSPLRLHVHLRSLAFGKSFLKRPRVLIFGAKQVDSVYEGSQRSISKEYLGLVECYFYCG